MSYRVVVTREDDFWLGDVPSLEGAHTWARTLPVLDRFVREAIVLAADLPDQAVSELELVYEYHTGDQTIDDAAAALRDRRRELVRLEQQVAQRTEDVARKLVERGYSVRDTAALTGVSYQRVSQLTREAS